MTCYVGIKGNRGLKIAWACVFKQKISHNRSLYNMGSSCNASVPKNYKNAHFHNISQSANRHVGRFQRRISRSELEDLDPGSFGIIDLHRSFRRQLHGSSIRRAVFHRQIHWDPRSTAYLPSVETKRRQRTKGTLKRQRIKVETKGTMNFSS